MTNHPRLTRALTRILVMAAGGLSSSARAATAAPQASNPCALLTGEETQPVASPASLNGAARMFPGLSPDQMRKGARRYAYARTTACLKGQVLQIHLDGIDAQEKKGQLIGLLKSAASRL